jgi:hypothetical protein
MKTSCTDSNIYYLAARPTAKNVQRRCKMNEMRVVQQWWRDESTALTVLTTRLLPRLCTYSILHITQVDGSP